MIKCEWLIFGHPQDTFWRTEEFESSFCQKKMYFTHKTINHGLYHYHRFMFIIQGTWGLEKEKRNRKGKFSSLSWDKGIHPFTIYLLETHKLLKPPDTQDIQNVDNCWNWVIDTSVPYTRLFLCIFEYFHNI